MEEELLVSKILSCFSKYGPVFVGLSSTEDRINYNEFPIESVHNISTTMQLSALYRIGQVERVGRVVQENRPFTQITRRLEGLHSRQLFHYDVLEPVYMVRLCEKWRHVHLKMGETNEQPYIDKL